MIQQRLADVAKMQSELDQIAPDAKMEHVEVNGHSSVLVMPWACAPLLDIRAGGRLEGSTARPSDTLS